MTDRLARQVLEGVIAGEGTPAEIVDSRGLKVVSDDTALIAAIDTALEAQPDVLEKIPEDTVQAAGAVIGAVMKAMAGSADATRVRELVFERAQKQVCRNCLLLSMYGVYGVYAVGMEDSSKRGYVSQADIPGISLESALRVPQAIAEQYGKAPTRPIDVAAALDMSPTSGPFRQLCGAAVGYGVTEGGPNAPVISLTELGRRIVAPLEEGDDLRARREAVLVPTVVRTFLQKYDGSPLPLDPIARNVLESMSVPPDRTQDVFSLIVDNAKRVGYLKRIKDKTYVDLSGVPEVPRATPEAVRDDEAIREPNQSTPEVRSEDTHFQAPHSNAIFLGHGKNVKPLEQLIRILNEYGIPHKEAIREPNAGRPIPTKVAEIMRDCGAAILIFTADQRFHDEHGTEVWYPSENVANELGAASVLYDNRIVIFKEVGVTLASNYSSIGYIEFEKDKLFDKGIELFRELVSFKIVSIKVG